jgi:hypothetical protein
MFGAHEYARREVARHQKREITEAKDALTINGSRNAQDIRASNAHLPHDAALRTQSTQFVELSGRD